jgi:hypothetical protein
MGGIPRNFQPIPLPLLAPKPKPVDALDFFSVFFNFRTQTGNGGIDGAAGGEYSVPQTSHDLCLKIEFLTTTSSNSCARDWNTKTK